MTRPRRGFTLIEMLVATVLSAVLLGSVLLMTSAVGRDRNRLARDESSPRTDAIVDRLRWDLTNADAMSRVSDGGRHVVLYGHGGIDPRTLMPNGRFCRLLYEIRGPRGHTALFRRQDYLDDPVRRESWTELVALDVDAFQLIAESADATPMLTVDEAARADADAALEAKLKASKTSIPSRLRLIVQRPGQTIEKELWLR